MKSYRRGLGEEEEEMRSKIRFGAGWMLLAFCRAKTGDAEGATVAINKAMANHADDITSQLLYVRTLEVLGRRDEALTLAARCVSHGATRFQLDTMSDLQSLRNDPRYVALFDSVAERRAQAM